MRCPDLPLNTALADETREFEVHARECARCAARLEELRRVEQLLGRALSAYGDAGPCPPPEALLETPGARVLAHLAGCADCRFALRAGRAVEVGANAACVSWAPELLYPQDRSGRSALREAEAHAWSCAPCDDAYTELRFSEQRLGEVVLEADPSTTACPEPGELLTWLSAPLTPEQGEHLKGCADCRSDLRLAHALDDGPPAPIAPRPNSTAAPTPRAPWTQGAILGGVLLLAVGATALLLSEVTGGVGDPTGATRSGPEATRVDPQAGGGARRGARGRDARDAPLLIPDDPTQGPGTGPGDLPPPADMTGRGEGGEGIRAELDPATPDGVGQLATLNPLEDGLLSRGARDLATPEDGALTGEVPARDPRSVPDGDAPAVTLEVLAADAVEVLPPGERVWTRVVPGPLAAGARLKTHDGAGVLEVEGARLTFGVQTRLTLHDELALKTGQVYVDGQLALTHALCRFELSGQALLEGVPGEVAVALVAGVATCTDPNGVVVQLRPGEVLNVSVEFGLRAPETFPPEAGAPAPPSWVEEKQASFPGTGVGSEPESMDPAEPKQRDDEKDDDEKDDDEKDDDEKDDDEKDDDEKDDDEKDDDEKDDD